MQYDFETRRSRHNIEAMKWDSMDKDVAQDIVPLSVADMELLSPPEIIQALKETAEFEELDVLHKQLVKEYTRADEQQKLVEKVSGLQSNLDSFKAAEAAKPKPTIKERLKADFSRKPKTGEAAETK